MNLQTITIKEYLTKKGIDFMEINDELLTRCFFNGCDNDSTSNERHLYFNIESGLYDCKKCGEKGNLITLQKYFNENTGNAPTTPAKNTNQEKTKKINPEMVNKCHDAIPDHIREYLHNRGITDEIINEQKLGWGKFYGKNWITIPITDADGTCIFLKLRKDPTDETNPTKYKFFPIGNQATIYGWNTLQKEKSQLLICEGEFDRLILIKNGIPAITSTAGAGTFKKEWLDHLKNFDDIHVVFDKDNVGEKESEKLIQLLAENLLETSIHKITLPDRMTDGKDISDYFNRYDGNSDELIYQLSTWVAGLEPVNVGNFEPMNSTELANILGMTIKQDHENKIISFLCQLSAYTESAQFNISFNAPSSTGKSYIPTQIAKIFPKKDVVELAQCSPTAFFHDFGKWNEERKASIVDLSRKIIIFLDQPHNDLLARLRPVLSHDEKEIMNKITDRSQKNGLKTKNILIKGFPSVIFCTANLKIDEQEATRFILLSPETSQEKLREGVTQKIDKEVDPETFHKWLAEDPKRKLLKERIRAISKEKIQDIKINSRVELERIFLNEKIMLKPRHQRDIGKLISIIKTFTLLNLWFRERNGDILIASESDIQEGVAIWEKLSDSQDYNLPPYIYNIFLEIILPAWNDKGVGENKLGLSRQEIIKKHYEIYKRPLADWLLRQEMLPMLESCGLISQEPHPTDGRKILIYPTVPTKDSQENNSEQGCVVN
ncbi:MAG: toprim domain-containing protein [bacterium]